jgi:hypothetical protein
MSSEDPTVREFAALACALAATRGLLYGVLKDDYEHQEVARILAGTSSTNIASVIGSDAETLAVDWNEYLTEAEQRAIKGATQPTP